jgi:hypothetical protein
MTTHGCGYQPGDDVTVDIGGYTIPGVVSKISPYKIHVNMSGCHETVEPSRVTAKAR